jgi:ABC-type multidrug transport system fused ATPase/permease subunit
MPDVLDYQSKKKPKKDRQYVWRAAKYLGPYKRLVVISIVCAFFAGGIFFSGLGAVLPVLQTLLNGDTPQMWVDRMVAEERLSLDLDDDPNEVRIIDPPVQNLWVRDREITPVDEPFAWPQLPPGPPEEQLAHLATAAPDKLLPGEGRQPLASSLEVPMTTAAYLPLTGTTGYEVPWHLRLLRRIVYLLPSGPVGAVAAIMGGILVLSALANLMRYIQEFLSNKAALSAVNDIRRDLYEHTLRAPLSYFGKTGTGDVTSRIVGDCGQLQEGFRIMLGRAVQEPIFAIFAFAFALWMDWRLTLFVIGFAPVMLIVLKRFATKMRRAGRATLQQNAELLGQVESTLGGIRVVKANNAEAHETHQLRGVLGRLLNQQMRLAKYDAMSTPVMETLAVLAVGVIVTVATYLVRIDQSLSAPQAILVFGALVQIAESLRRVSKLNIVLQRMNAAGDRVFEAIDTPVEAEKKELEAEKKESEAQKKGSNFFSSTTGKGSDRIVSVGFEHVTFHYQPDQPLALVDVSLHVNAGSSVAVVGKNGSGKTTLLSLLPRFYEPQEGRITIDGTDIRDLPLDQLRDLVGIVTQDAVVFPGTIRENLAYGKRDATQAEIEAAARQAEAHEFILDKPGGYDFPLTGLGGQLSGGQRQRLNIARAILRDPPILILDEATSQVDAQSEHLIQEAVARLMEGRTTFVIAHRFSTILDCDQIALMDAGRLVALGPHDELLATNDIYRDLYERQLVAA